MEEIIELVHTEIITSGFREYNLAGGLVITGGGSQLHNAKQLFEYMTGMDARIGYPNEHLGQKQSRSGEESHVCYQCRFGAFGIPST